MMTMWPRSDRVRRLSYLLRNGRLIASRQKINWTHKRIEVRTDYVCRESLGPYYLSLREKLESGTNTKALLMFAASGCEPSGAFYHPTVNGHVALALYERYLETGEKRERSLFLEKAEELLAQGQRRMGALVWPYPAALTRQELVPWLSAMGQGHAIAVLARAYEETGAEKYLKGAMSAFVPFTRRIAEGGVRSDDPEYNGFLEEYAYRESAHQFHTLNGMMAALMCLWDLAKVGGSGEVRSVVEDGVAAVRRELAAYDFGFCSAYDLRHVVARKRPLFYGHYNAVHVAQLKVMSVMTGDAYFGATSDAWDKKLQDRGNRRRLRNAYFLQRIDEVVGR